MPLRNARVSVADAPNSKQRRTPTAVHDLRQRLVPAFRREAGFIATTLALPRPGTDVEIQLAKGGRSPGALPIRSAIL
jgi:hypothetical protein